MSTDTDLYSLLSTFNTGTTGATSTSTSPSQSFTAGLQTSMTGIKDAAATLSKALSTLLQGGKGSAYNQLAATADKTDNLTVKTDPVAIAAKAGTSYEVKIKNLATTQLNTSEKLKTGDSAIATANGTLSAGTNTFSLTVGGTSYNISVEVGDTDTNDELQKKVAQAINSKKTGVTASIITDGNGNKSLSLAGAKSGANNDFSLSDKAGGVVSALGLNNVTTEAKDAAYTVDGGDLQYSASNTVTIDKGITATLKKATDANASVKIDVAQDTKSIVSGVKDLVSSYNALLQQANTLKANGSSYLATQLSGVAKTYANSLQKVGVTVGKDGTLAVDETKLTKAATTTDLQRAFDMKTDGSNTSTGLGFLDKLKDIAKTASKQPDSFLSAASKSALEDSRKSKYDTTKNMSYQSTFSEYDYYKLSQWQGLGTMFDSMK